MENTAVKFQFICKCCSKKTTSLFFKEDYIITQIRISYAFQFAVNNEWDHDRTILLMCVWCSSLMNTHITNVSKYLNKYTPSVYHKPTIVEVGIQVIKNRFNPKSPRSKNSWEI